ncbi:MAG: F-type H+-transporting ATPase subunit b [Rickettsiales bacterium]|jgi:F-type H+-transporting ATPase subunit b
MIFSDPTFWLAVSFSIFTALILKYVLPKITAALDNKSKQIADDIAKAKNSKEQADQFLIDAKKHYEESTRHCQKLIEDAKNEGKKLFEDAEKSLEVEISKRTSLAKERITAEEEKIVREIKSGIISAAIKAIEIRAANISSDSAKDFSKKSINDISKMIH